MIYYLAIIKDRPIGYRYENKTRNAIWHVMLQPRSRFTVSQVPISPSSNYWQSYGWCQQRGSAVSTTSPESCVTCHYRCRSCSTECSTPGVACSWIAGHDHSCATGLTDSVAQWAGIGIVCKNEDGRNKQVKLLHSMDMVWIEQVIGLGGWFLRGPKCKPKQYIYLLERSARPK